MPDYREKLLIAIPTHKRPEGLRAALKSLEDITAPQDVDVEVLVVENNSHETAGVCVVAFERFPTHYILETNIGLAHVRNRILNESKALKADYLAGLDDDETADRKWLAALWQGLKQYHAAVVTGPVLPQFETPPPPWLLEGNFFVTKITRKTGKVLGQASTNNYLIDLKFLEQYPLEFDLRLNCIGSEDTDYFARIAARGGRIVWIREAVVYETIPAKRMTLRYLLRRDLRIGIARMLRFREKSREWALLRGFLALLIAGLYVLVLPLCLRRAYFYKTLCKIVKQFGIIRGLFNTNFRYYG